MELMLLISELEMGRLSCIISEGHKRGRRGLAVWEGLGQALLALKVEGSSEPIQGREVDYLLEFPEGMQPY